MYFKISVISQNHNMFCSVYVQLLDMFVVPNYTLPHPRKVIRRSLEGGVRVIVFIRINAAAYIKFFWHFQWGNALRAEFILGWR